MDMLLLTSLLGLMASSLGMVTTLLLRKQKVDKYDEVVKCSYTPAERKQMDLDFDQRYHLDRANELFLCECGKYSRRYQQELKLKDLELKGEEVVKSERLKENDSPADRLRIGLFSNLGECCPHCSKDRWAVEATVDDWPWLDTHPDCPKIDYEGYLQYQNTLKEVEQLIYDIKSMEAYQKYNGFELQKDILKHKPVEHGTIVKIFDKSYNSSLVMSWSIESDIYGHVFFSGKTKEIEFGLPVRRITELNDRSQHSHISYWFECYSGEGVLVQKTEPDILKV